jgi:hypothetical protein
MGASEARIDLHGSERGSTATQKKRLNPEYLGHEFIQSGYPPHVRRLPLRRGSACLRLRMTRVL